MVQYTLYTCACGYSYQDDVVSKLGHDYTKVSQIGSYVTYECSRCGDTYTTRVIIIDPPTPPIIEYGSEEEAAVMTASSTGCSSERVLKATVTEEHSYIYASGKLLRETITTTAADGTVTTEVLDFCYDAQGNPYSLTRTKGTSSAETYYYITNLQGDVTRLVTSTGATAVTYSYDAYGRTDINYTSSTYAALATSNPLRYRGYYYDTDTGFYYLLSRYYDPNIGRFINADSYASTGQDFIGYNMFAYCNNNPVINSDPSGNLFFTALGAATGFISGAITAMATGQDRELWFETACHGAIGGAIAGAGVDAGLLILGTAGVTAPAVAGAVAAAYALGGAGNVYSTHATATGELSAGAYIGSFLIGGTFNTLSLGTGLGAISSSIDELILRGMMDFAENLGVGVGIGISTSAATTIGTSTSSYRNAPPKNILLSNHTKELW